MNKTILFFGALACLIVASIDVVAQKRYNDLAVNNLYGSVKSVVAQRMVFDKDCGHNSSKIVMYFAPDGYIVKSNDFEYNYRQARDKYVAEMNISTEVGGYECYRFNIEIGKNSRRDSGICTTAQGLEPDLWNESWLAYEFDANGRLSRYQSGIIAGMKLSMWNEPAFGKVYGYKGEAIVPYKVKEEVDLGGDGWSQTLLYKYESMDVKGNWTKRKAYLEESGKLLMEESRTIEYYTPGEMATYNKIGIYKL